MNRTIAQDAWRRWQAAAGPWQGWSICPTLLSPEVETLPRLRPQHDARAAQLAAAMHPSLAQAGGTLCVLDLQPTLGVQIAARLAELAHPVLVLPRWPYAEAILLTDELLAILIAEASALPSSSRLPNVVLVLDGERSRPVHQRPANDQRADNRFPPASFELPDLATLRARDIRRIHRFSHA